jgi:hypothetical protein
VRPQPVKQASRHPHRTRRPRATRFAWALPLVLGCASPSTLGGGPLPSFDGGADASATDAESADAGAMDGASTDASAMDSARIVVPARCATLCARLVGAPGCAAGAVQSCEADCARLNEAATTPVCAAFFGVLLDCATMAPVQCVGDAFPFPGCMSLLVTYSSCVVNAPGDGGPPTPPPRPDAGDRCGRETDCVSCTMQGNCGWCAGRCLPGTAAGPSVGSCDGERYYRFSNTCPPSPAVLDAGIGTSCASCGTSLCGPALSGCVGDAVCASCLRNPRQPACASSPAWTTVRPCLCTRCRSQCNGPCVT